MDIGRLATGYGMGVFSYVVRFFAALLTDMLAFVRMLTFSLVGSGIHSRNRTQGFTRRFDNLKPGKH